MEWRVEIRGQRLGEHFNLQAGVKAANPVEALQLVLRRWGITEEMLNRIHIQEYTP